MGERALAPIRRPELLLLLPVLPAVPFDPHTHPPLPPTVQRIAQLDVERREAAAAAERAGAEARRVQREAAEDAARLAARQEQLQAENEELYKVGGRVDVWCMCGRDGAC